MRRSFGISFLITALVAGLVVPIAEAGRGRGRGQDGHRSGSHGDRGHSGGGHGYRGNSYRGHGNRSHGYRSYSYRGHGYRSHGYRSRGYYGHGYGNSGVGFALGLAVGGVAGYVSSRPQGYYYQPYRYSYGSSYYVYQAPYRVDTNDNRLGEIETDVKPDSAAVYLDGEAVGVADDFNGWPGKLKVTPGRHQLLFREPGYEPLIVDIDVLPGHDVRVKEQMVAGQDRYLAPLPGEVPAEARPLPAPSSRSGRQEARDDASALVLHVEPADAGVYVDGRLWSAGSGTVVIELSEGDHRIEVVKPGYQLFTAELTLGARQRQELTVRLDRADDY